ncbi:MAG: hypothetical protein ABEH77_02520 [Halobacteriaceae archaeon]
MDDGDDEWEFSLEELGGGEEPLSPGDIDPESAAFFVLGVAFAVAVLVAMAL